jgi:acetyltransferase-like isoleucine patch superfamily enzyme
MLKIVLRISNLLFAPIPIFWNSVVFSCLYFFIGSGSAFLYFERVSKRSVTPILRLFGASIGKKCSIQTGLTFHNCSNFKNLTIGDNCHIGKKCFFDLRDRITIKDNVVISMQTTFITHQDFYVSSLNKKFPSKRGGIFINSHSYIGARSTILMDIIVGEKSVIGANSLVNRNVEANTMVGGVPAKIIRKDFV